MRTKELTRIAFMAAMEYVVFMMFSSVLYLEAITLILVLFATTFSLKESLTASLTCNLLLMIQYGVHTWTIGYLLAFTLQTLTSYSCKKWLLSSTWFCIPFCFLLSFLLGTCIDLPFLLISDAITYLYLIMGFKTSLIQAIITAFEACFLFQPLQKVLIQLKGTY